MKLYHMMNVTFYKHVRSNNSLKTAKLFALHVQIQKFCQRGSNFDNFFFVDEGWEDPNTTISDHHRPASETPFK